MDRDIDTILGALEEFNKTSESVAIELRMSLVAIVLRHMKARRWTQRELASRAEVAESFLSRVLHGENNSTIDTFANLLNALGARGRLDELSAENINQSAVDPQYVIESETHATYTYQEETGVGQAAKIDQICSGSSGIAPAGSIAGATAAMG